MELRDYSLLTTLRNYDDYNDDDDMMSMMMNDDDDNDGRSNLLRYSLWMGGNYIDSEKFSIVTTDCYVKRYSYNVAVIHA